MYNHLQHQKQNLDHQNKKTIKIYPRIHFSTRFTKFFKNQDSGIEKNIICSPIHQSTKFQSRKKIYQQDLTFVLNIRKILLYIWLNRTKNQRFKEKSWQLENYLGVWWSFCERKELDSVSKKAYALGFGVPYWLCCHLGYIY